ncbi:MAG TPA: filamentous hemagglutinin N-terminal domain-containing protein [Rhodocyclaceae bacterium]|nr:filamentous hemagglutinin N-terminal domain-containing protein [Rhodocyclaceae bacterium]
MARNPSFKVRRGAILAFAINYAFSSVAFALPQGAVVTSGQVGITQPTSGTMNITASNRSVINWNQFSVGAGELVRFFQPSASSTVLNRVVGQDMSVIYGTLRSNGRVFLINPNGIIFGAGAVVDTAGLVASSLQMSDVDFTSGNLRFGGDAGSGAVINQGWIRTGYGGEVALIAPQVSNSGVIETPGGGILLAAGQKVTVTSIRNADVSFEVQAPGDTAVNLGKLIADGGVVGAFAGTLKHSGEIRANSLLRDSGGQVVLAAQQDVELTAGSTVHADGRQGGSVKIASATGTARVGGDVSADGSAGTGGRIEITGDRVSLVGDATIDVSGTAGGGTLLAGGDWQGKNAAVRNASTTFVGSDVTLRADATDSGDGGKIVVWSNGNTRFLGTLSAQGGPNGGNGGNAEVSGKGDLLFVGGARLGAPQGNLGNLLLDPLDLFVDTVGGIIPGIIDESTDFPNNTVTVSPATLAAISGNVTLYASRDMRFNSAVTLTGAGQGLAATAGRDLQLGSTLTTNGGAVSLTAGRNLIGFGTPQITTGGGAVTLNAQVIAPTSPPPTLVSQSLISITAGTGAVTATATAGGLRLANVTSSGSINLSAAAGNLTFTGLTSTGAEVLSAAGGSISGSSITAGGAVSLTGSNGIFVSSASTGGGALTGNTASGSISVSNVDTRLGGGPTGGAVSFVAPSSSVFAGTVQAGSGAISLSGRSVSTGTMTTTGNVGLTATAGSISATVNEAASVTANASNPFGSSVSLSSTSATTALNATSVSATATTPGSAATVQLYGLKGVNVGTVTANAVVSNFYGPTPEYQSRNRTVTINGDQGSILAMGSTSQVTATNVTLRTSQGYGGGIGSVATPLRVDVERSFDFRPNGEFNVQLVGSGAPNNVDLTIGVAPTGANYVGTLTRAGAIALDVSANDATVTVNNFNVTSGFNTPIYGQTPDISVYVPNGNLTVTSMAVPMGDQVGFASCIFYYCGVSILGMPVSVGASGSLAVASFTRQSGGTYGKTTSFFSNDSAVTLGAISGSRDSINASADTGIALTGNLTTLGSASLTNYSTGDIVIGGTGINTAGGGTVSVTNYGSGAIRAAADTAGLEVTAGGAANLYAANIDTAGFVNPFDVSANSVSLTGVGASSTIGHTGAPVIANTTNLTINAGGKFNVDTGAVDLINLGVAASPTGVGTGGLAQVASNGTTYGFASDGSNFTLANWTAPAAQFAGGTLSFTTTAGNVTLNNIDFSASNGSLSVRTNQSGTGDITQTAASVLNLGTGTLTLAADHNVTLDNVTAGGMNANYSTGGGCEYIGSFYSCGLNVFAAGNLIGTSPTGMFSVTARHGITTGNLELANFTFVSYAGGITTSTIGTSSQAAGDVTFTAGNGYGGGSIQTGAIDARAVDFTADHDIVIGSTEVPLAINANNPGALSVSLSAGHSFFSVDTTSVVVGDLNAADVFLQAGAYYRNGVVRAGDINATAPAPANVEIRGDYSITTGSLDANAITIGGQCCLTYPAVSTGAVGSNHPGSSVSIWGSSVNIGGPITLDTAGTGQSLYLQAYSGDLTVGGAINMGAGSLDLRASGNNTLGGVLNLGVGTGTVSTALVTAGDTISLGGAVTAENGSTLTFSMGSGTNPFNFTRIDAGVNGTISVSAPAGIWQQQSLASGGGILAGTVSLSASGPSGFIDGLFGVVDLREATSITLDIGDSSDIFLSGASGAKELTNLDITRRKSGGFFSLSDGGPFGVELSNVSGPQTLTISAMTGGVNVGLSNGASGALNFRYVNADSVNPGVFGTGITTNGGFAKLQSVSGTVDTGTINTLGAAGDGAVLIQAATGITVSNAVNAGASSISLTVDGGSITKAGSGSLTASSVDASASSGNIGASGNALPIAAESVSLFASKSTFGGDVFASLTGTTSLDLSAQNGFTVTDSVDLQNLSLTTYGTGSGATSLTTTGNQTFTFARSGTQLDIGAMNSTTPLASVAVTVNSGDIRVVGAGSGTNVIDALSLYLYANGNLTLDGIGNALLLVSDSQTFQASNNLLVTGRATLTSIGGQTFNTFCCSGDIQFAASGGNIVATAATQTFNSGRDIIFAGGATGSESVSVSATGNQSLYANRDITLLGGAGDSSSVTLQVTGVGNQYLQSFGSMVFAAGTGAFSSVNVVQSGSGTQTMRSYGNVTMAGGGGVGKSDSSVLVSTSGGGQQWIYANGAMSFSGGAGDNGFVKVANTGGGIQRVGYSYCCDLPTDSINLSGGDGANSYVEFFATGRQFVETNGGTLSLAGGIGSGSFVRIQTTDTVSGGTHLSNAAQVIGYSFTYDCCSGNQFSTISLQGGSGTGAFAEILSAGSQRIAANTSMLVTGGSANGSYAKVAALSQDIRTGNTTLAAGTGDAADALIVATGTASDVPVAYYYQQSINTLQYLDLGNLTLTGAGTAGVNVASAKITSGYTQFVDAGTTLLTAGAGPASVAEITAPNAQYLRFGNTVLTGGSGVGSRARIESGASQELFGGSLTLLGGSAAGTQALVKAASGQTIDIGNLTMTGGTGNAGAGNDASALIVNVAGAQSIDGSNFSLNSGADFAAAVIQNLGTSQTLFSGNLTIGTTAGTNSAATVGGLYAGVTNSGSGAQTLQASTVSINNANAPGTIGVLSGTSQTLTAFGNVNVQSSGTGTTAKIATTGGNQIVGASGTVTVQVTAGDGLAAIDAVTGAQTIRGRSASTADAGGVFSTNSANSGMRVQVTGGSGGTARIQNSGGTQTLIGNYLDIKTTATGTALVNASGDQAVHTTNGTANPAGSLHVAAVGGGSATLSSGGDQLLQIDYPEFVQATRDGHITVGDPTATGNSTISAAGNQNIFARFISILGGNAGGDAKIDVAGNQTISLVASTATPSAGINVQAGAGGKASIDPVVQTIVSGGPIDVLAGTAAAATASILATGDQTILVTLGDVTVAGGSALDAIAQITTSGASQLIAAAGTINLVAGTAGMNADAIVGAGGGSGINLFACGGGTCVLPNLTTNPFASLTSDAGVFSNPIIVPIGSISGPIAGAGTDLLPFDPTFLLLEGYISAPDDEESDRKYRERGLEVCR